MFTRNLPTRNFGYVPFMPPPLNTPPVGATAVPGRSPGGVSTELAMPPQRREIDPSNRMTWYNHSPMIFTR